LKDSDNFIIWRLVCKFLSLRNDNYVLLQLRIDFNMFVISGPSTLAVNDVNVVGGNVATGGTGASTRYTRRRILIYVHLYNWIMPEKLQKLLFLK
jgi:hypothetical protein